MASRSAHVCRSGMDTLWIGQGQPPSRSLWPWPGGSGLAGKAAPARIPGAPVTQIPWPLSDEKHPVHHHPRHGGEIPGRYPPAAATVFSFTIGMDSVRDSTADTTAHTQIVRRIVNREDNALVAGANVVLYDANNNNPLQRTSSDALGRYRFVVDSGNYYLGVTAMGRVSSPAPGIPSHTPQLRVPTASSSSTTSRPPEPMPWSHTGSGWHRILSPSRPR